MSEPEYDSELTGLLVIDPYNDFISEGGKVCGRLKAVAVANGAVPNMLQALDAARKARFRVFYSHATLEVNLANYANAIVTTNELLESISPVSDDASGPLAHALH